MSARAQTIFGASLPPEWEGSTKGELRVRVDKLLLDDDTINQNPLVKLFGNDLGAAHQAGKADRTDPSPSAAGRSALVSPNRFVVPVDHCEVGPLFWGEPHPSSHCQPATAGKPHRGASVLVYPIKCSEEEFARYLANMTASPHHGMQLEIYVPSSYSGRPPVPVGKSVVCLDALHASAPITGWFTVAHYQRTADGRVPANGPLFIPVGKVKLHIQVVYFTEARGAVPSTGRMSPNVSRGTAGSADGSARPSSATVGLPSANHERTSRRDHHRQDASGQPDSPGPAAAQVTQVSPPGLDDATDATAAAATASAATGESALPSQSTIAPASSGETLPESLSPAARGGTAVKLQEVLRQGLALHSKMTKAVHDHLRDSEDGPTPSHAMGQAVPHHAAPPLQPASLPGAISEAPVRAREATSLSSGPMPPPEENDATRGETTGNAVRGAVLERAQGTASSSRPCERPEASVTGPTTPALLDRAINEEDIGSDVSQDTLFTSEASEDERGLQEAQARDATQTAEAAGGPQTTPGRILAQPQPLTPFTAALAPPSSRHTMPPAQTGVDLVFSDFSFASTATTGDLAEIRIQVRLSSDITTQTPGSGPFSSYIHQLPLSQATICLSFNVCSYSEENSRLVVEVFKVHSRPRPAPGATLLPPSANTVREVVGEELLGLAIVGLYRQSRDIVMREPVLDVSHVYAHLQVFLNGSDTDDGDDGGHKRGSSEEARSDRRRTTTVAGGDDDVWHEEGPQWTGGGAEAAVANAASGADGEEGVSRRPFSQTPGQVSLTSPTRSGVRPSRRGSGRGQPGAQQGPTGANEADEGLLCGSQRQSRTPTRPSVTYVAPTEAQAATSGIPMLPPTAHNRCRLHLAIHSAKHIPLVKVMSSSSAAPRGLAVSRLEDSSLSDEELGRHGFAKPNTFFVVEEVLSGIDDGQPRTAPVAEWFVEQAVKGHFDRTAVAFESSNPTYAYESIISLPAEGVFLKQDKGVLANDDQGEGVGGARPCLRELVLTLWHYADGSAANIPRGDSIESERAFWSRVAYVGECRVDLRSLRHLNTLNGYYRVVFTPQPTAAAVTGRGDALSSAKLEYTDADKTIGYVHLTVSLLGE